MKFKIIAFMASVLFTSLTHASCDSVSDLSVVGDDANLSREDKQGIINRCHDQILRMDIARQYFSVYSELLLMKFDDGQIEVHDIIEEGRSGVSRARNFMFSTDVAQPLLDSLEPYMGDAVTPRSEIRERIADVFDEISTEMTAYQERYSVLLSEEKSRLARQ